MKTFCDDIYYKKRILKCISLLENKCYVFIGNKYQHVFSEIKKNIDNDTDDPFKLPNNPEKKIKDLYYYLTSQESDDFDLMKKEIIDKIFITGYISHFIYDFIYDDDTNEKVLMKISEYCYNASEPTPSN